MPRPPGGPRAGAGRPTPAAACPPTARRLPPPSRLPQVVAAYLLAALGGNAAPAEADIKKILSSGAPSSFPWFASPWPPLLLVCAEQRPAGVTWGMASQAWLQPSAELQQRKWRCELSVECDSRGTGGWLEHGHQPTADGAGHGSPPSIAALNTRHTMLHHLSRRLRSSLTSRRCCPAAPAADPAAARPPSLRPAVGIEAEAERVQKLLAELEGKDINEVGCSIVTFGLFVKINDRLGLCTHEMGAWRLRQPRAACGMLLC